MEQETEMSVRKGKREMDSMTDQREKRGGRADTKVTQNRWRRGERERQTRDVGGRTKHITRWQKDPTVSVVIQQKQYPPDTASNNIVVII